MIALRRCVALLAVAAPFGVVAAGLAKAVHRFGWCFVEAWAVSTLLGLGLAAGVAWGISELTKPEGEIKP